MSMSDKHLRDILDEREKRYTQLREEQDKRYEQRFQGQEVALGNARESINRRLDLLNELRQDIATEAELRALQKVVDDLKDRMNLREGKGQGFSASWAILLGAVTVAVAVYLALGGPG